MRILTAQPSTLMTICTPLWAAIAFAGLDDFLVRGGRGGPFYHVVFFYLALVAVFADKILAWISEKIRKDPGLRPLILWELGCIFAMVVLTCHLKPIAPALSWWEPIGLVVFWIVVRSVHSLVCNMFGFDGSG
jgi:hypothetical protein